jgi:hypothetical protein
MVDSSTRFARVGPFDTCPARKFLSMNGLTTTISSTRRWDWSLQASCPLRPANPLDAHASGRAPRNLVPRSRGKQAGLPSARHAQLTRLPDRLPRRSGLRHSP